MSKKDKKQGNPGTDEQVNYDGPSAEGDDDFHDDPEEIEGGAEGEGEDEDFEFDPALMLQGVELVDLTPDFIRPEGFLMVPRIVKKTGEIFPPTATFAGILNDVIEWQDNRKKKRIWFACTATSPVTDSHFIGRDENDKPKPAQPVQKGQRIGISGSGAISALKSKKGHFVLLHWTGAKKPTKNGDMWEIIAKVSKEPVEKTPS